MNKLKFGLTLLVGWYLVTTFICGIVFQWKAYELEFCNASLDWSPPVEQAQLQGFNKKNKR